MIGRIILPMSSIFVLALTAQTASAVIIPQPVQMQVLDGSFTLQPGLLIGATAHTKTAGKYLADLLSAPTGLDIKVRAAAEVENGPRILLRTDETRRDLGPEGYDLTVAKNGVTIIGCRPAGVFYGIQSLRQLLPIDIESRSLVENIPWTVPCVRILDKPRFAWRGALIDSGRHFQDKAFIKKFIDLMAMHKLNRLHWHLTDDQGWRVQIGKYPKLTEIGAWRKEKDGSKYGGFYTQQDLREIVAYAESRHVLVVPEIEMPGHCQSALAAYPQYSCTGGPFEVANTWGIKKDVYCPGNDATFAFIESVLGEVADVFPSPWIHIGGDEVPKDRWKACPKCQARIKAEKLKDEAELQSWFVKRVEKMLAARDRRLIGWDEILEGGLAPNAVVQSWRGIKGGIAAASQGHDVIMSPTSHCYLDYTYEKISTEKAYSYEPTAEIPPDAIRHVLGVEGNLWGEVMPTTKAIELHAFPRLTALAEVGWSQREAMGWRDFQNRLMLFLKRLDKLGVQHGPVQTSSPAK